MLTIQNDRRDHREVGRRDFVQIGLLGPLAFSWLAHTHACANPLVPHGGFGRARRCIMVFLNGGPSQLDLWDMKPEAPAEVRGELNPIATSVPGTYLSELLPMTARCADKFKIVRSVTHNAPVHTTAVYTMLTGTYHQTPGVDQTRVTPGDHPHLGSIVAHHRGRSDKLPSFVCLPSLFEAPPVEGIWPGQNAGFLGPRFDPLVVHGDKKSAQFGMPTVTLPSDVSDERVTVRRELLAELNRSFNTTSANQRFSIQDELNDEAFSLIGASALARAANVALEPDVVRDRYGRHLFGQELLLARRLAEANVPLITAYWNDPTPAGDGGGEFDSHGRIYWHMRNRLVPPMDQALSALVTDLDEREMLHDTLLVVMSEFGRTPRINPQAGRDHWPSAQSILLAGAGISAGTIHGATDGHGAYPTDRPVTPPDLAQTILHLLGVPADLEIRDRLGRSFPASRGEVLHDLMA